MCLSIKRTDSYKIAKKDITVYKHVSKTSKINEYLTPYCDMHVKIGETYKSKLVKDDNNIEEGLHSFTNIDSARMDSDPGNVIVQCTIPKGARYYLGCFIRDNDSYASNRLRYDKLV